MFFVQCSNSLGKCNYSSYKEPILEYQAQDKTIITNLLHIHVTFPTIPYVLAFLSLYSLSHTQISFFFFAVHDHVVM